MSDLPDNQADRPETPVTASSSIEPVEPGQFTTPATPATTSSTINSPRPKRRKPLFVFLIILLLLLIIAAALYTLHANNKPVTATKKDIPQLRYELTGADLSQEYPFDINITENRQVDAQLFEGLVQYDQLTKITPLLATSWSNPTSTTWVFNLRQGIKFHSGRTMTATDVKYSLDYAVAHQNDNDQSNFTNLASTIKQVDVLDPYKVKITTDGPDPVLLNRLTYLYILDSKGNVKDFNDGTGAYTIKPGTKPTASQIDLTAFDGYHGGHVYTRNLSIHIASDADQMTSDVKSGKYDLAGTFTDSQLSAFKNYQVIPVQDLGVSVLGLNTLGATSPFQTLQGRQAAAYALNIPAILKAGGLRGQAASQIIPVSISGYDPSIKVIPYDPAKAKQLLASVSNASTPVTLDYNDNQQTPLLTEIAHELDAAGFNIKLSDKDFNTVLDEGLGGKVDMFYATVTSNTLDGADILNSALEGNQIYKDSEVDSMLSQANTILDPAARLLALQKISRLVASEMPYVPLYTQTRSYILTKPYQLQTDIPSGEVGAYFWQVYQK